MKNKYREDTEGNMIKWRFLFTLKGMHASSPDIEPVSSFLEKYPELQWVTWCDEHFADCYFDLEGYDEKGAWEYFKSLSWVSKIIKENVLQKIEVVPILCRTTVFPKQ
jgi:hypothetical protein